MITPPLNTQVGAATFTDSNGNEIGVGATGTFTDTLGTTALTVSGTGTPTSPVKFGYHNPSSNVVYVTANYVSYNIKTNFQCSGVSEYSQTNVSLITSVTLPDGSKYVLTYETTPGNSGYYTGRLASIQLPSGGLIAYAYNYTDGHNGIVCADGSADGLARTLTPGGTWTYSRTPGSGNHWQTKVTSPPDPSTGNDTIIDFEKDSTTNSQNFYETQRQLYQGTSSGGGLLLTLLTCYNGYFANCIAPSSGVTSPISQVDAYRQVPTSSATKTALSEYVYNAYGILIGDNEYDYGVATGSAPTSTYMIRQTGIQYANLGNNITNRPSLISVSDGQGNIATSTKFLYDETSVTPSSNTPQHLSVNGSRGNVTTISSWVSGPIGSGPRLIQHFTYYDTGNINTATDVNGAIKTYKFGACGNSFPTEIDLPLGLTEYLTWDTPNCYGAVVESETDVNGNKTTYSYTDMSYWRLTGTSYPDGGATTTTYSPATVLPWNILQSSKKDTSTTVTSEMILDGFGRTHRF